MMLKFGRGFFRWQLQDNSCQHATDRPEKPLKSSMFEVENIPKRTPSFKNPHIPLPWMEEMCISKPQKNFSIPSMPPQKKKMSVIFLPSPPLTFLNMSQDTAESHALRHPERRCKIAGFLWANSMYHMLETKGFFTEVLSISFKFQVSLFVGVLNPDSYDHLQVWSWRRFQIYEPPAQKTFHAWLSLATSLLRKAWNASSHKRMMRMHGMLVCKSTIRVLTQK